jgi:electron-transferring-flavoprotein dehydrogenase
MMLLLLEEVPQDYLQQSSLNNLIPNLNVCLLEKASEIGAHILSGNVFETRALDELLPNWRELNSPIKTKVSKEKFLFLGKN